MKGVCNNATPSSGGSEAWTGRDAKRTADAMSAAIMARGTMLISQTYTRWVVSEQYA